MLCKTSNEDSLELLVIKSAILPNNQTKMSTDINHELYNFNKKQHKLTICIWKYRIYDLLQVIKNSNSLVFHILNMK